MKHRFIIQVLITVFLIVPGLCRGQNFTNPILRGAHPDPSICRVGEDFYIVNSSFEFYPGLPISHSRDLVNWELVGYGIHRPEQCGAIGLFDVQHNGGIHAPTIRYNNGTFYIIVTSVYSPVDSSKPTQMINFIITAQDPAGPWSEPHVLEGAVGIDPDIFFDDDGKVWYVGTCNPGDVYSNGIGEIWAQELDLKEWKLVGKRHSLWRGACGGFCVEGPHMYKKDGVYYLMVAEGGTGYEHSEVIAASKSITGPFESNLRNPIMTSRHLSFDNWVSSTGHADLVELSDGRWYMVCLGIRNEVEEHRSNMGRETHLLPVVWEQDGRHWLKERFWWPVCAPQTGRVERLTPLPYADREQYYNDAFHDNFDARTLDLEWNFRRCPKPDTYSLAAREGYLRLYLSPEKIDYRKQYHFMGILQKETNFEYAVSMDFTPRKEGAEAGISLCQIDDNYINLTVRKEGGKTRLVLVTDGHDTPAEVRKSQVLENYNGKIVFKVVSKNNTYSYYYSLDNGENFNLFATTLANIILCYSYSGARLGVYATSNGSPTKEYADFDWVSYCGFVKY